MSPSASDLVGRWLVKEPRNRLSLALAARHPFFTGLVAEEAIDAAFADARRIERRREEAARSAVAAASQAPWGIGHGRP